MSDHTPPSDGRVTLHFGGDTSRLELQLLVISKYSKACAEELARLRTAEDPAEEVNDG